MQSVPEDLLLVMSALWKAGHCTISVQRSSNVKVQRALHKLYVYCQQVVVVSVLYCMGAVLSLLFRQVLQVFVISQLVQTCRAHYACA